MARINFIFFLLPLMAIKIQADPKEYPEHVQPSMMDAYSKYWEGFDAYEKKAFEEGEDKYHRSWGNLSKEHAEEKVKLNEENIKILNETADRYEEHLRVHQHVENTPSVMLNLAVVYQLIAQTEKENGGAGRYSLEKSLKVLDELSESFPYFAKRDEALYHQALILLELEQREEALVAWKKLSEVKIHSLYVTHAFLALGDNSFQREEGAKAVKFYKQSLENLESIDYRNKDQFELLRAEYRLLWAYYQIGDFEHVLEYGRRILSPGKIAKTFSSKQKIEEDAIDLIGQVVAEKRNFEKARDSIKIFALPSSAARLGLKIISVWNKTEVLTQAELLGNFLVDMYPSSFEYPFILHELSSVLNKMHKEELYFFNLEKLALLLPEDSLWRKNYGHTGLKLKEVEKLASEAAAKVAEYHYERGVKGSSSKHYHLAASFYSLLNKHNPYDPKSSSWLLQEGNSYYFAEDQEKALGLYKQIIKDYNVEEELLKASLYQIVLTCEKRWRTSLQKSLEISDSAEAKKENETKLNELESAINDYVKRYPKEPRSVDILLAGANAYREQNLPEKAHEFWQRVLFLATSPSQRSMAIKGIVYSQKKTKNPGNVIDAVRRFLRLENFRNLDPNLRKELLVVFTDSLEEEGKRLEKTGNLTESGTLLIKSAEEFHDLPKRSKIFRDGAYMLALAGNWVEARNAAEAYLKEGNASYKEDFMYLEAKSQEYLFNFSEASRVYFDLSKKYPMYAKSKDSILRAVDLAISEDQYLLAAEAEETYAIRIKSLEEKIDFYKQAILHYTAGKHYEKSVDIARRREKLSDNTFIKYESRLLEAKANFLRGQEHEALKLYQSIFNLVNQSKETMGKSKWSELIGECSYLIAEESRKKFELIKINITEIPSHERMGQKRNHYNDLKHWYEEATRTVASEWVAKSRFALADITESYAQDLSLTKKKNSSRNLQSEIEGLLTFSRKLHTENVLEKIKNPAIYAENPWIEKSALRLAASKSGEMPMKEWIPKLINYDLPYQWSL